jgi:hypothetical protein
MRTGDRTVALLIAAGFTGMEVSHASSLLAATAEAAVNNTVKASGQSVTEALKALEPHVERIAADHPNYEKWWHETAPSMDPEKAFDDGFEFGLERLLDGLDLWLARRSV